jgi:hypothetical protein
MKLALVLTVLLSGCSTMIEYPVTSAGLATTAATGKGFADHVMSYVSDADCQTLNVIMGDYYCYKTYDVEVVDRSFKQVRRN